MSKITVARSINQLITLCLGNRLTEMLYCCLGRNAFTRKLFRVGALIIQYTEQKFENSTRLAQMNGYKVLVDIREFSGMHAYFFREFTFPWFAEKLLKSSRCFFDVGSNMGHWALAAASLKSQQVFAFEPHPKFAPLIRESASVNGFSGFTVVQQAASDTNGDKLEFFPAVDPRNSGTSSLVFHGVGVSAGAKVKVETVRLDEFLEKHSVSEVDVMKVDVERAEDKVIRGLKRTLENKKIKILIVEMLRGSPLKKELENFGYHCAGVINDQNTDLTPASEKLDQTRCDDYLFEREVGLFKKLISN